ncbi:MAG: hypothetical protein RJA49_676, partial [Actinomycetota bacterium]
YVATVLCLSAAVALGAGSFAHPDELAVFGLSMLLGPIYLADVTLVSLGRVDLALRGWLHGLAAGLSAGAAGHLAQLDPATAGAGAAAIGLLVCAMSIAGSIRTPVVAAVNHH